MTDQKITQLIANVKQGDSLAFDQLMFPIRQELFQYFFRRFLSKAQAEDLCQETLFEVFTSIDHYDFKQNFRNYVFEIALRISQSLTKDYQPYSPDVLQILQEYLLDKVEAEKALGQIFQENAEHYQIRDHVSFCFNVLLHTLLSKEHMSFLLWEFFSFAETEIAALLGEPVEEIAELNRAAESNLKDLFFKKCSLVNREGSCQQCQEFARWLEPDSQVAYQLAELELEIIKDPQMAWEDRLELVKALKPLEMSSVNFHEGLFAVLHKALGEK